MIKVRVEVRLGPAELFFLLEDLLRKLDFRLTAGPAKKAPFLKVEKIKQFAQGKWGKMLVF